MKKAISLLLALVMCFSLCACFGGSKETYDEWPTGGIGALLPAPDTEKIEIYDFGNVFSATISSDDAIETLFSEYVAKCESAGFTVDTGKTDDSYEAYNQEGYHLSMYLFSALKQLSLNLEAPSEEPSEAADDVNLTLEDISYDWSQGTLAEEVPLPEAEKTEMLYDGNDRFRVNIYGDLAAFQKYVERCKKRGYTYEPNDGSITYYSAFRKDGARVEISFDEDEGLYELLVRESWIKDALTWPEAGLAAQLPTPKGTKGTILSDSPSYFSVFVGETTKKDYLAYIEECKQAGFTLDEMAWDGYFSAHHETDTGNAVTVTYEGLDTIHIEFFTGQN